MNLQQKAVWVFAIVATLMSLFYGVFAVRIFIYPRKNEPIPQYVRSWWVHQFWLNFMGSLAGWAALAVVINRILRDQFQAADLVLVLIALAGIGGFLPSILSRLRPPNVT